MPAPRHYSDAERAMIQRLAGEGHGPNSISREMVRAGHPERHPSAIGSSDYYAVGRKVWVARRAAEQAGARAALAATGGRYAEHPRFPGVSLPALSFQSHWPRSGMARLPAVEAAA